ncbi:hypothetical protein [Bacillus sp. S3]|nr:hypothetical protein [Bacillus sp. S3]
MGGVEKLGAIKEGGTKFVCAVGLAYDVGMIGALLLADSAVTET